MKENCTTIGRKLKKEHIYEASGYMKKIMVREGKGWEVASYFPFFYLLCPAPERFKLDIFRETLQGYITTWNKEWNIFVLVHKQCVTQL